MANGICSVDGCARPVLARGLCHTCYEGKRRRGEITTTPTPRRAPVCTIEGCDRKHKGLGLCVAHLTMLRRAGDPLGSNDRRPRRRVMDTGYVAVWAPHHPLAMADGYVLEHRKVLHDAGVEIPAGYHVHHINHDRTDNRVENLAVLSAGDHSRHHAAERKAANR